MAQTILTEAEMREYIEKGVRSTLMNEEIDEGIFDFLGNLFNGSGKDKVEGFLARIIRDHFNFPDFMNLLIGIFGVAPIVKWFCELLGIDVHSSLAKFLITALVGMGTVAVGDRIQNSRRQKAANGEGGIASIGGGDGFSGGGTGGGNR